MKNTTLNFYLLITGIPADLYLMPDDVYGNAKNNSDNACYDTEEDYEAIKGLQNISPCQYSMYSVH